jgi:hypothetical protein
MADEPAGVAARSLFSRLVDPNRPFVRLLAVIGTVVSIVTGVAGTVVVLRRHSDPSPVKVGDITVVRDLAVVPNAAGPAFGDPLTVTGTVSNREPDRQLWLAIATDRFYPQERIRLARDGPWEAMAYLGDPEGHPASYTFSVVVVEVDGNGDIAMEDHLRAAQRDRNFLGLDRLPAGSRRVAARQLTLQRLR